ncbi:hypothetical protein Scep_011400 [Stephania cephalantha]|uniref:Uncharacterized protein n=1 Tax=Stephania cephalantha TaxID=152367 RepID=A0AAP0P5I7_9MAGN
MQDSFQLYGDAYVHSTILCMCMRTWMLKNNATFIKYRFKRSILTTPVRLNFLDSRLKLILHHFLKVHKSIQSI